MDEVVVTASRIEESKKTVSANVTVITSEEIQMSPSRSVADLLAEYNVGHIHKYPGNNTSIGIRGFRTDTHGNDLQGKVLVLLDGRRAGSGNVDKFTTENVERIEIVRGPGSVQYGSAGMGGVVNIITKQGAANSIFAEAGAGSFDTYEASVGGEVKEGNLDFAGAISYSTEGDYETGGGDTYSNTGVDYETALSANLGYSFNDNNRVGVILTRFYVEEAGSPSYLSQLDLDDHVYKNNWSVDLNYNGANSDKSYQWMARFFFGEDHNNYHDPVGSNPTFWDDGVPSRNETEQLGAQLQGSVVVGTTTVTAGADWINYDVTNTWDPKSTKYNNPAIFALGKTSLLDEKLTFNYGLRYDWYQVEVAGSNDEDTSRLTPFFGIAAQLNDNVKVRAQYAQGFLMPSAQQLAGYTSSWGTNYIGNPNLNPEKSTTYEGGIDVEWQGFTGSVTYFYTDYEDKIITGSHPTMGDPTWFNVGESTIAGFEIELGYDIGQALGWDWEVKPFLNATLLTDFENEDTGQDLYYVSGTTLSTGIVVNNGDTIKAKLNVSHTSSQDVEDWENYVWPTVDIVEMDDFTVVDLSGSWKFYEDDQVGAFTIRGEVTNLFDEDYAFAKGYVMPGRGFFVSLRWDY